MDADKTTAQLATIADGSVELPITHETILHTGSTTLNLACSDRGDGGFVKGGMYHIIGECSSGKTFWLLSTLAEAANNPNFDDYALVYDNAERANIPNLTEYFGSKAAARIQAPGYIDGEPVYSTTTEEFYATAEEWIDEQPCIYMLDCMDALTSDYDNKKIEEKYVEVRGGKKAKQDYGDGKAKLNSRLLRRLVAKCHANGSMLFILSQERDNVGGGMFDPDNTHAGGRALKFYATIQLWLTKGAQIKKEYRKKQHQIGVTSRIKVTKNKLTGKEWTVEVPILRNYGIDDAGTCIDYLVDNKQWHASNGYISAPELELDKKLRKEDLVLELLNSPRLLKRTRILVHKLWLEIEEAVTTKRPRKYT